MFYVNYNMGGIIFVDILHRAIYVKKQFENLCLYAPRSCMLFVNGTDDDAKTCAFSRRCYEANGIAVNTVCGGLPHLRKYDFFKHI